MSRRPITLVTGASRGLGREVARRLAEYGHQVLAGVRRPSASDPIPGVEQIPLDVADPASIRAASELIRSRFGRLDALVNNAGILLDRGGDILSLEAELLYRTLETNCLGPLRLAQTLAPLMPKGGRIVNVSSGGGQLSQPSTWAPAYCMSKTTLNALTVQLAEALRPRGIAVDAVCPGWVRTDLGGPEAPRSLDQGAESILWLLIMAGPEITGGFWRDGERIPW
ncbi:MAG TPA: SDR family NAD(P)-dependent oxidoreductase [Holophagaceae bacterium]